MCFHFPDCSVFNVDCNVLLKKAIEGSNAGHKDIYLNGQRIPRRGEVELLCGGPPCQGFSQLNRFQDGQASKFSNSLIASYLSVRISHFDFLVTRN